MPCKTVNSLVHMGRLLRPAMPYMPQLAAVSYRQHERPRASKRDARHFFHVLKSGRAWRPFFAGRHVLQRGKR
eukprot:8421076-Lingulodinium_polyedra.AAC.1